MAMRKNAGRGLARVTELVHEIAMKNQPNAVGAIGHIDVYPNSRNIIPGKAVFTADLRSPDLATLRDMVAEFDARAPEICDKLGCRFDSQIVSEFAPPGQLHQAIAEDGGNMSKMNLEFSPVSRNGTSCFAMNSFNSRHRTKHTGLQ